MAEHIVTVYYSTTCLHCVIAKKYLDEKGIVYTGHDVAADKEKRKEMVEKSGQMGVPVIVIDGRIIIGFDAAEVEAALGM